MTYHRTGGKGGTRNSPQEKHCDEYLPNFNKSQGSGANPRGRKKNNPPSSPRERYDSMMAKARVGIAPKPDPISDFLIGPSSVRRPVGKKKKK